MLLRPRKAVRDTFVGIVFVRDGEPFVLDELDSTYPLAETPPSVVLYALERKPLALLVRAGRGKEKRWNHDAVSFHVDGQKIRLVRGMLDGLSPDAALSEVLRFADWLRSYGASVGTFAGSASALLRATLPGPVRWRDPKIPPDWFLLGARIEKYVERGRYDLITQWDISGAYPSSQREITLPREYVETPRGSIENEGFSIADVRIPKLPIGPLPWKQRVRTLFPTGEELSGFWPHNELRMARDSGCVVNQRRSWEARGRVQIFSEQWDCAVIEGRNLDGIAGRFAKATTNTLWGTFAMQSGGEWWSWETGDFRRTEIPNTRRPSSPAFAAGIVARVRERLYREALCANVFILGCHTDGILTEVDVTLHPNGSNLGDWRIKRSAVAVDYIGPTMYRMFAPNDPDVADDGWYYVIAGKNTQGKARKNWSDTVRDGNTIREGRRISKEIEARRKAALPWTERVESS